MTTKIKISPILSLILFIILLFIVWLYIFFTPKRFSHYCVKDKCVSVVTELHLGIDSLFHTKIYDDKVYTRFFLDSLPYQACPWDTQSFVSKDLTANKILIYCVTDDAYSQTDTNNSNFKPNNYTLYYIFSNDSNIPTKSQFIDTQDLSYYTF